MRIMISCGEASGDLYAGALATELRRRAPDVELFGFGGRHLGAAGAELVGDFRGLSVTGLTEALRVIPRSLGMLRRLTRVARERRPDVCVAIDFPDFNFRLVAALHRLGIAVVYYVSPQLWAWRPGRMQVMQSSVDRVLVIFPFEEDLYRRAGVPVEWVGHPLVDLAHATQPRDTFLRAHGLLDDAPVVALLPGSRANELERIVPIMALALPLIRARVPGVQFVVAGAPNLPDRLFAPLFEPQPASRPRPFARTGEELTHVPRRVQAHNGSDGRPSILVRDRTDDVLAACDVAITASGTATVQCALHERPMVVVYRLSPLTYRVGKPFVKVDMYAMANLVAGGRVVPELIQENCTPERVTEETVALLLDRERYARVRDALRRVRERLGAPGASGRAADAVLAVASRGSKTA
jgi:lipid-A-disaccharide synthase